jgi:putative ABC transport system permease protein
MAQWQASLPENAPDHFMINIQPGEIPAFRALMARNGLPEPPLSPLVRGRVTEVNGVPVAERTYQDPRGRRWLERERNLSWSARIQEGNQVLEGDWWDAQAPAPGLLSVEQEFARQLGLGIGDLVRFDLAGEAIEARVSSIRRVRWDSFRPNFFLVLSPGTVDDSLANFLTSVYVPPSKRGVLMDLARELPGITVFDVGAILDQVRGVMDKAALAVQYVFLFTVAAGIVVLLAAVQSTGDERRYESAMLRTLGASRRVVLMGVLSEFGMLGILSGLLAAAGANIAAYLLAVNVFQLEGQWNLGLWLAGPLSGLLVVGVSGYFATRSVVNHPPVSTLRNEHA